MDKITLKAPAKINLFLKVIGKRPDDYHDIYSWFQAVDLYDVLHFAKNENREINLSVEGTTNLSTDKNNLIIKTASMMFRRFQLPGGLNIKLEKKIPIGAGMAGGSTDAASTIYAISKIYDLDLENKEMANLGLEIGSDVPFFFSSGQAEVTGRGEIIKNIVLPSNYSIMLIVPRISVSTKMAYKQISLDLTSYKEHVKFKPSKDFAELVARIRSVGNDFEKRILKSHPVLDDIRVLLDNFGAAVTRMSGTGPTIFGLFEDMPEGGGMPSFTRGDWRVFFVQPITLPAWD